MDPQRWARLQALFDHGADLDPAAQQRWLAELAGSEPEMIAELTQLLAADRDADTLPDQIERYVADAAGVVRLESGDQVGRYTIEDLLGVGGMGAVYRARRSDSSYRQQVVIKIVDAAPDAELARLFERERQILADLVHPNIARLLDGGKLDSGHPYLVMEYVDGEDIARWCDSHQPNLEQRLGLFIEVCRAVQFAHSNLIVHRDIKPENVMVDRDGRVRLLDFGIATLLRSEAPATEVEPASDPGVETRTLRGAMLSPAYASPEQHRRQPVTTASDIYSLGVLLYRLLTDSLPARPDTAPPSRAVQDPDRSRRLAGDLDAIVMHSLELEPEARYPTVNALVADLRRFLDQRPVDVRNGGWMHDARLFVRRNRGLSASLAIGTLLVLGFSAGLTWLAINLETERQRAVASAETTERVAGFMVELFAAADPEEHLGETITARQLLDRGQLRIRDQLIEQPEIKAQLLHRMAEAYRNLGLLEQAEQLYDDALSIGRSLDPDFRWQIELERADLVRDRGRSGEAIELLATLVERVQSPNVPLRLRAKAFNDYGLALALTERFAEAEHWARQALAVPLPDSEESAESRVTFSHNLALAIAQQGRLDEAIELLPEVIEQKRALFGPLHPSLLLSIEVLAGQHRRKGELAQAAALFEDARAKRLELYGPDSGRLAALDNELANVHHDAGRYAQAEQAYLDALDFFRRNPQDDRLLKAFVVNNLASLYGERGHLAPPEPLFRESLELRLALNGEADISVVRARINLARLLVARGALDAAEAELDQVHRLLDQHFPDNVLRRALARRQDALLASARGDHQQARRLIEEALEAVDRADAQVGLAPIETRMDAARIELAAGRPEAALQRLEGVERVMAERFGEAHPRRLVQQAVQLEAIASSGTAVAAEHVVALEQALREQLHPDARVFKRLRTLIVEAGDD